MTVDGSTVLLIILVRITIEQFHFFIYIRFNHRVITMYYALHVGYVQTPDRTGSGLITGSDRIGPGFLCYVHFFFDILFFMHSWKRFTAYKTIFTSHLHSNIKKKNGPNITPPIYI